MVTKFKDRVELNKIDTLQIQGCSYAQGAFATVSALAVVDSNVDLHVMSLTNYSVLSVSTAFDCQDTTAKDIAAGLGRVIKILEQKGIINRITSDGSDPADT